VRTDDLHLVWRGSAYTLTTRQIAALGSLVEGERAAHLLTAVALTKLCRVGWAERISEAPKVYRITSAGLAAAVAVKEALRREAAPEVAPVAPQLDLWGQP